MFIIVHSGLLSKTTMRFDKAHFEYVKSVDEVPEEGWMKVIFWAHPRNHDDLAGKNFNNGKIPMQTLCPQPQ
jgi:hypothetical protein